MRYRAQPPSLQVQQQSKPQQDDYRKPFHHHRLAFSFAIMPDWGMGQAVIALIVIPAVIPRHWWSAVGSSIRRARLTVQPNDGQCQLLSWDNIEDIPAGNVHRCDRHGSWSTCDHGAHMPGATCYEQTLGLLFNRVSRKNYIPKPESFPLDHSFLATSVKVIYAYILCTIDEVSVKPRRDRPQVFDFGGICIKPTLDPTSGEVLVHIIGSKIQRNLTKHEVECLLDGYPPFYREYMTCNNFFVPSPIQSIEDVARGGWVIGVGLSSTEPILIYMDTLRDSKAKRGTVFYRSFIRVKAVLVNNIQPLFPDDKNVQATINAITYMIEEETQSGVERALQGSDMASEAKLLSQPECILAMRIFNDSPRLDSVALDSLRQEITPILFPVLKAALEGVTTCIAYVKNPGREMDMMIPKLLEDAESVFVQGCP